MTYAEATKGWPRDTCPCGMELVWEPVRRTKPGEWEYKFAAYYYAGPYDLETGDPHREYTQHRISARRASVSPQRAVAVDSGPVRPLTPGPTIAGRQQPPSEPSQEVRRGPQQRSVNGWLDAR